MGKKINMAGRKCGRLTVLKENGRTKEGRVAWLCRCECGNLKTAAGKHLRNGYVKSCGCLHIDRAMEHVRKNEKPVGHERINNKGYVVVKTEEGFRRKHIYVMEQKLGRKLRIGEVVHHVDGNKLNNTIENLSVMLSSDHTILHHTGAKRSAETRHKISVKAKARAGRIKHPSQKLSKDQVIEIRFKYEQSDSGYTTLARQYGVTRANIRNIVKRKTWRYVA